MSMGFVDAATGVSYLIASCYCVRQRPVRCRKWFLKQDITRDLSFTVSASLLESIVLATVIFVQKIQMQSTEVFVDTPKKQFRPL